MADSASYPQQSGYIGLRNYHTANSETNLRGFQMDQAISKINTMKIVRVISCTNAGGLSPVGFVDVQPLVNQMDGDNTAVPHGIIHNIPYSRLQGGTNAIIIDPVAGDIGWCGFCDRDISAVKNTKAQANPGSRRTYDNADGIYFGGCLNGIPVQYVMFSASGITVVSPNTITLQAPTVAVTGNLTVSGTTTGMGDGTFVGTSVHLHEHTSESPGTPTSPPI